MGKIVGIGVFRFKDKKGKKGKPLLDAHVLAIKDRDGCEEAWVGKAEIDSESFLLFSRWTSMEAHVAMETAFKDKEVKGADFVRLSKWLKDPPLFGVYHVND